MKNNISKGTNNNFRDIYERYAQKMLTKQAFIWRRWPGISFDVRLRPLRTV